MFYPFTALGAEGAAGNLETHLGCAVAPRPGSADSAGAGRRASSTPAAVTTPRAVAASPHSFPASVHPRSRSREKRPGPVKARATPAAARARAYSYPPLVAKKPFDQWA